MSLCAEEFLVTVAFTKNPFDTPLVLTPRATTTFFTKKLMT